MTRRPDGTDPADEALVDRAVDATLHVRPGATTKSRRTLNALEEAAEIMRLHNAREEAAFERGRKAERAAIRKEVEKMEAANTANSPETNGPRLWGAYYGRNQSLNDVLDILKSRDKEAPDAE